MTTNAATTTKDITVERVGDKLIVPEHLSFVDAMAALQRRHEEENQDINVNHQFLMTPPEGALAFLKTLRELFGFVNPTSTPGFFGPKPPEFSASCSTRGCGRKPLDNHLPRYRAEASPMTWSSGAAQQGASNIR